MSCKNCKRIKEDIRETKGSILSRIESLENIKDKFFKELKECRKILNISDKDYE